MTEEQLNKLKELVLEIDKLRFEFSKVGDYKTAEELGDVADELEALKDNN